MDCTIAANYLINGLVVVQIRPNELHVWHFNDELVREPSPLKSYAQSLSDDERQRYNKFRFEHHRHQFLVAHGALRQLLSKYVPEISAHQWKFKTNKFGKPSIANERLPYPLEFNLSHTPGNIAFVIANGLQSGIDVEANSRQIGDPEIIQQVFSASEHEQFSNLSKNEKQSFFLSIWTLKEAYVKALGAGLQMTLTDLSFELNKTGSIIFDSGSPPEVKPEYWNFFYLTKTRTHTISLAALAKHSDKKIEVKMFDARPEHHTQKPYRSVSGCSQMQAQTFHREQKANIQPAIFR